MKAAVIQFPGSNNDRDAVHALYHVAGLETELVWHRDFKGFEYDAVILPGGFSYGDHLRAGAIAAHSPAMKDVKEMASEGKPVLGICNGFQILIEAELLPGALLQNEGLTFVCKWVILRTETSRTVFTNAIPKGKLLRIPVAHNEGRYIHEERVIKELEENDQIVFRYVDQNGKTTREANPNGALHNIAGICNREGNVMGMMPHPERSSESILDSNRDGLPILQSMINVLNKRRR